MCNERRNHSICYTTTTYEVHSFTDKNERKSLRDLFVYHFLFCLCLFVAASFVIIETRAYDITHDRHDEFTNHSKYIIGPGRK